MDEIRCIKFKLNSNKDKALEWAQYLQLKKEEVLQTLIEEGISLEASFLYREIDDSYSIFLIIKSSDVDKALKIYAQSTREIDIFNKQFFVENTEKPEMLKNLFMFENN